MNVAKRAPDERLQIRPRSADRFGLAVQALAYGVMLNQEILVLHGDAGPLVAVLPVAELRRLQHAAGERMIDA